MNRNLDVFYQREFGITTLHYPGLPIGPTAVESLLRQVGEALNIDPALVESVVQEEKRYLYQYFDSMTGTFERLRYILVGESNTVLGIACYLTNDAGHIPMAVIVTDSVPDKYKPAVEAEIKALECDRKADVCRIFIQKSFRVHTALSGIFFFQYVTQSSRYKKSPQPFGKGIVVLRSAYSRCAQLGSNEINAFSPTANIRLFTGQLSVIFTSVSPMRT